MNKRGLPYGYLIVICCCLIMGAIVGLVMSCAGSFYQPVSTEMGCPSGLGLYMTFVYALSFLMLSVAGKLLDHYSARWILTLSAAVIGALYMRTSRFTAVWHFCIAGAVLGVSLSFLLYLGYRWRAVQPPRRLPDQDLWLANNLSHLRDRHSGRRGAVARAAAARSTSSLGGRHADRSSATKRDHLAGRLAGG